MEIYKSNKGKNKIHFQGFSYRMSNKNKTTLNWRCDRRNCKGSLSTPLNYEDSNTACVENSAHNHAPDPAAEQMKVQLQKMIHEGCSSNAHPRHLISTAVASLTEEALASVPKKSSMTRRIQRARSRAEGFRPEPTSLEGFQIPPEYQTAVHSGRNVRFLLHDNMGNDEDRMPCSRIIVYASDSMLDLLADSKYWMFNGTFKFSPPLFAQVFTIHAIRGSNIYPCAYALLSNQLQSTYQQLLHTLKKFCACLLPEICIVDFDSAIRAALLQEFPKVEIQDCFHFTRSLLRNVQTNGLTSPYTDGEDVGCIAKSLRAPAFLPIQEVYKEFEELDSDTESNNPGTTDHPNYFEDVYVGNVNHGQGQQECRFPPAMCTVHDRTLEGVSRTNDHLDGWHSAFQTHLDSHHSSIFKFLKALQCEEGLQYALYTSSFDESSKSRTELILGM